MTMNQFGKKNCNLSYHPAKKSDLRCRRKNNRRYC